MSFQEHQKRALQLTPEKLSKALFDYIKSLEGLMAQINRDTLTKDSKSVDDQDIGFYSKATEIITTGKFFAGEVSKIKAEGEPFDLIDQNKFIPSIFAIVDSAQSIYFDATDPKKEDVLNNLLTKNIFGLQDKDLKKLIDEKFLPFYLQHINNALL